MGNAHIPNEKSFWQMSKMGNDNPMNRKPRGPFFGGARSDDQKRCPNDGKGASWESGMGETRREPFEMGGEEAPGIALLRP
jgi:hypothetical protein